MRVLHFIPDIGITNGISSMVLTYAKNMPDDIKFDVCYFLDRKPDRKSEFESLGGHVYKLPAPGTKELLRGEYEHFFKKHRGTWQVLHINAPHFAFFLATGAKREGIDKIFVHAHSSQFSLEAKNEKRNKILYRLGAKYATAKLACGIEAGRAWYGKSDFTVIPNSIDYKKFKFNPEKRAQYRKRFSIEDRFAICHIGDPLISEKNHPYLFKIFAEIKKQKPGSVLLLIGASETQELKNLAAGLNIAGSIFYLGSRTDVADLLSASDVFIFPSTHEGLPVSPIEAGANGLPVLISNSVTAEGPAFPDRTRLSPGESPEKWADEALTYINHKHFDSEKYFQNSEFNIKNSASILADLYTK